MTTAQVGMVGFAPTVKVEPLNPEIERYRKCWDSAAYREYSRGEGLAMQFLEQAKPKPDAEVIDFGCGTGRGALMLAMVGGMRVTMLDFAKNCLDQEVAQACESQPDRISWHWADLEKPIPFNAAYGYCCDVMEHIPREKVRTVLTNILCSAQHVFFNISTVPDNLGHSLVGGPLHLTVQPAKWWIEQLQEAGALIHWHGGTDREVTVYCTAWMDGKTVVEHGVLNIEEDKVLANVRHNTAQDWQQVEPHPANDVEVMLVGGGPTLAQFADEIRQKRKEGVKLIALNGAYNWCLEQGLEPSAVVVVDARPFNARFTHPVVDHCKYLIASQVDPSVLEGLPKDRTYLWHTTTELIRDVLDEHYKQWWAIPGGSTVLLRAIPLLRMLGFKRFHLYGCDSCLNGEHHAYPQPENDEAMVIPVTVSDGRVFQCHPWMVSQAQEFMDLIKFLGDEIEIATYGDGLLNHILETGAQLTGD